MLVCTGSGKVRFYIFTNEEEISKSTRDVQNEKPRNLNARQLIDAKPAETGSAAILHTTFGDIHIRLFPEAAPKAVENFVTHSKNGYYNNTIFHRVIRKFMIQVSILLPTFASNTLTISPIVRRPPRRRYRGRKHLGRRICRRVFFAQA